MGNTGYKFFESLELYYTDDNSYAGVTKANINSDPDYIAPFLDASSCPPATRYYNEIHTLTVAKNDCSSGYIGSEVTLTANANQFVSTISQADANNQAIAWLNENAQVYANNMGQCALNPVNFEISWGWQNYNNNSGTFQYKVEKNTGSGWEILLDRDDTIYTNQVDSVSDYIQSIIPSNTLVRVSGAITQTADSGDSLSIINKAEIIHNSSLSDTTSIYNIDQNFGLNGSYSFEYNIDLSDYEILENDVFSIYINVDLGN